MSDIFYGLDTMFLAVRARYVEHRTSGRTIHFPSAISRARRLYDTPGGAFRYVGSQGVVFAVEPTLLYEYQPGESSLVVTPAEAQRRYEHHERMIEKHARLAEGWRSRCRGGGG